MEGRGRGYPLPNWRTPSTLAPQVPPWIQKFYKYLTSKKLHPPPPPGIQPTPDQQLWMIMWDSNLLPDQSLLVIPPFPPGKQFLQLSCPLFSKPCSLPARLLRKNTSIDSKYWQPTLKITTLKITLRKSTAKNCQWAQNTPDCKKATGDNGVESVLSSVCNLARKNTKKSKINHESSDFLRIWLKKES